MGSLLTESCLSRMSLKLSPKKRISKSQKLMCKKVIQGEWKVGATQCLDDPAIFCMGWCCPCILGWMIAKKLGENPLFYCLGMYVMPVLPLMRQRTREKYGITPDLRDDTIMSGVCCQCFGLCQVHNEIKARS